MKKFLALFLALMLMVGIFAGCTTEPQLPNTDDPQVGTEDDVNTGNTGTEKDKDNLTFALVYLTGTGTYASQFIKGFRDQCAQLGITAIVSDANGSQDTQISYIDAAINQKVDAIIISHGEAAAISDSVQKALDAGIVVITKDVDVGNKNVSVLDQDDYYLSLLLCKEMCTTLDGEGSVVRAYANGYTPQERRYKMYQLFLEKYTGIEEIATFGSVSNNSSLEAQNMMEAILKQYPEAGAIDAVFCGWEEWAKGASRAIVEAGRSSEIKVFTIDISDEVLQMMQDPNDAIYAASGVDPEMAGKVGVRMALAKIFGEFVPQYYNLVPEVLTKPQVLAYEGENLTMAELGNLIDGWGENNDFWYDWMKEMVVE